MTIFVILLVVLGMFLFDARKRLKQLEQRIAQLENGSVISIPDMVEPAPSVALESPAEWVAETPEPIRIEPVEAFEPEPEPAPVLAAEPEKPGRFSFGFEDLFGRRLPIWAGGVTLAVAGVLLVKYSIDAGLLSPAVRIFLGLIFGAALIGGAEIALRQEDRVQDPRVRQALAGAGLATLYVSVLAAHTLYDLVGPFTAFAGLAAVTAGAIGLSLRFGAPSALLGLVGGLAAPALVDAGQPNVPLLSCYLALAIGGLCALSRTQRWMWLGVGALVGGAGWAAVLLATGVLDAAASLSLGLLVLALGVALPFVAFSGRIGALVRLVAAIVAAAQMAALVATGGFELLHWGLFGLLSAALVWLAGRETALRPACAVGLVVALMLAIAWPDPLLWQFTLVLLIFGAIYGAGALLRLWKPDGGLVETGQIAALALGGFGTSLIQYYHSRAEQGEAFALLALGAALLPAAAVWLGWNNPDRRDDARLAVLASAAVLLLVIAGGLGLPIWMHPIVMAAGAVGLLILSGRAEDRRVEYSGWAFTVVSIITLTAWGGSETALPLGWSELTFDWQALTRWTFVALAAALFAWRSFLHRGRMLAQGVAALIGYGALAQFIPASWLPVAVAAGFALVAEASRRLPNDRLLPVLGTLFAVTMLWALGPIFGWAGPAIASLWGNPMLVSDLAGPAENVRRLVLPAALIGLGLWRANAVASPLPRLIADVCIGLMGGIALHSVYKQLFGLSSVEDFIRLGLAERTAWQVLLLAAGAAVWRFTGARYAALSLVTAALAHNVYYTLLLHNPLWSDQAVGGWPLVNLLIPAFAVPFACLWLATRIWPELTQRLARPFDLLRMLVILLFGAAMLRQLFAGSILTLPGIGAVEDILRSVLAIALAVGFLLWGMRIGARDWRIASLLLTLLAVGKVFLFDASGLEGLLRIASFLALGFSLIGIGWLYNRVLRSN